MAKKRVELKREVKCPDCDRVFNRNSELGNHRRGAHGIVGSSYNSVKTRNARIAALKLSETITPIEEVIIPQPTAQAAMVVVKRTYTKRKTNGQIRSTETSESNNNDISEITLAIALGRFQQLCQGLAFEYGIPAKLFTARLAALVYATQVRR